MCQAQTRPTPSISIDTATMQSIQNVKLSLEENFPDAVASSSSDEETLALKRSNTAPNTPKRSEKNDSPSSPARSPRGLTRSLTQPSPAAKRGGSISKSLRRLASSDALGGGRIEDMRNAFTSMKRTSSRKLSSTSLKSFSSKKNSNNNLSTLDANGSDHQVKPDPKFFEMIKHDPTDPEERMRYNDTATRKYIRRHPEALQAKYEFQVDGGRLGVRRYPLCALIALDATLNTIKLAIKANPAALEGTKDFNSTALHTACSWPGINMEVVQYIYTKYPDAIKETTKLVYLPLHNACQAVLPSLDLIQFLVKEYPEGLMAMNKLGDTPLRTAERNQTISKDVLDFLQEETTRVFGKEENSDTFRKVSLRQSWGSKQLQESLGITGLASIIASLEDEEGKEKETATTTTRVVTPPSA